MEHDYIFPQDEYSQPPQVIDWPNKTLHALHIALVGFYRSQPTPNYYRRLQALKSLSEQELIHALHKIARWEFSTPIKTGLAMDIGNMLRWLDMDKDYLRPLIEILYPDLED